MNNNNKYKKEDFLKLYNILCDKDILEVIEKDILDDENKKLQRNEIYERINTLQDKKNKCTITEKNEIEKTIKKLKLIVESCVIDYNSKEVRREYLDKNIEKLIQLLEEILYDLVKLEEM